MNTPLDALVAEGETLLANANEVLDAITPLVNASAMLSEYSTIVAERKDWDKLTQVMATISELMEIANAVFESKKQK
jgi:hypothetical protein